jgi:hypothetical protein
LRWELTANIPRSTLGTQTRTSQTDYCDQL